MKSSNLAARMDPPPEIAEEEDHQRAVQEVTSSAAPRPPGFSTQRRFERRSIVIRDQGLPLFRVR